MKQTAETRFDRTRGGNHLAPDKRSGYIGAMSSQIPVLRRLAVEIAYDFVCPWCYLGIKRLYVLLKRRQDLEVVFVWRPFLLNPDMPHTGMSRTDYLLRKFGAEDRARRLYKTISEQGALEGIEFNFEAIRWTPDSVNAHRLVREASKLGAADALVMRIFEAHFVNGLDIGDVSVLAALAAQSGFNESQALLFLEQGGGAELIYAENLRAHRLGINGVPCFTIDGEHAISGAQENEVWERLIDLACSVDEKKHHSPEV